MHTPLACHSNTYKYLIPVCVHGKICTTSSCLTTSAAESLESLSFSILNLSFDSPFLTLHFSFIMVQNVEEPQAHTRKTHISAVVIVMLNKCPLPDKLVKNKEIEQKNQEQHLKSLNHALNPQMYPAAGSPEAFLITLILKDLEELRKPSVFNRFKSLLMNGWFSSLSDEMAKKRSNASVEKQHMVLLGRMQAAECTVGIPFSVNFSQVRIFEKTDISHPLPIHFFTNKNLCYITENLSTLPLIKANPLNDFLKPTRILDVAKICTEQFGPELLISCAEWTKVAKNYRIFQVDRDEDGPDGNYAVWLKQHLAFFKNLEDRIESFRAWLPLKIELRLKYRTVTEPFVNGIYYVEYMQHQATFTLKQRFLEHHRSLCPQSQGANSFTPRRGHTFPSTSISSPSTSTTPFHQATENCSSRPVAYFSQDMDMQLTLMQVTKNWQLSPMGHTPGPASIMATSLRV